MPPAMGSGLAAEKAAQAAARREKQLHEQTRKRRRVQFEDKEAGNDAAAEGDEPVVRPGKLGSAHGFGEDEEEEVVDAMDGDVSGEEDETGERFNEVGEVIEPFNLREEREDGFFDANGNYVWRKREEAPDEWLSSMGDEAEMEAAIGAAAAAQRKRQQHAREQDEAAGETNTLTTMAALVRLLRDGETVVQALKRLGRKGGPGGRGGRGGRGGGGRVPDTRTDEERRQFEAITDCANRLLGAGSVDIYQMDREAVEDLLDKQSQVESLTRAFTTPSAAAADAGAQARPVPPPAPAAANGAASTARWEYRKDGQVHGPFTTQQILSWRAQGYFTGAQAVEMRRVPQPATAAASPMDDLMADLDGEEGQEDSGAAGAFGGSLLATLNSPTEDDNPWTSSDAIDFAKP